jgi:hypothetical protein
MMPMSTPPRRSRLNTSIFVGLWLGLTAMVGVCAFAGLYFLLRRDAPNAPAPTTPAPLATQPAATATLTVPSTLELPTQAVPTADETGGGGEGVGEPTCNYPPEPLSGFGYGIQSHVFGGGDSDYWLGVVNNLGFNWVKMQVRWYDLEGADDQIFWDVLDGAMNEACEKGLRVMLSVVAAPAWTMANPLPAPEGQEAPPDDPAEYAEFLGQVIDHYPSQIGAIEVWNEMNLEREWNTADGVDPGAYVQLLQAAYTTIKTKDPSIIVISGALSPTGINCQGSFPACPGEGRGIVMDDVSYLTAFVEAGGLAYADCIGTHSNGTNLPPTADGANPPPRTDETFGGPWDNPHYSWALRSQVETYAAILNGQKQQCVTEFGYASPVGGKYPGFFGFAADVSEQEQAQYLVDAFNWMRDSDQVKLAFLFNLDYAPLGGEPDQDDNVIFSILYKDGTGRPAFDALGAMDKR